MGRNVPQQGTPSSAPGQNDPLVMIMQRVYGLEQSVIDNFRDVFDNQTSLKAGLDSAEFNLRAHQKVLNALVQEVDSLIEGDAEGKKLLHVEGAIVEGKLHVDWAKYHQYVDADIMEIRKIEAEKLKEEYAQINKEINEGLPEFEARKEAQIQTLDEDQRHSALVSLANFVKAIKDEMAKCESGDESFDSKKLRKLHRLIVDSVKVHKPAPSVAEASKTEYPEGASVFGG
jgi:plasmid stabilization system protein ParE